MLWPWPLVSVLEKLCPEHINCYIFWGRIPKYGVWVHLGVTECHIQFPGNLTLTSGLRSRKIVFISYIIWGRNPKYGVWVHLGVTECHILFPGNLTLTSSLRSRKIVFRAYPILFEVGIPNLVSRYILWSHCCVLFPGHCLIDLVLEKPCPEHFHWGHLSHCDTLLVRSILYGPF